MLNLELVTSPPSGLVSPAPRGQQPPPSGCPGHLRAHCCLREAPPPPSDTQLSPILRARTVPPSICKPWGLQVRSMVGAGVGNESPHAPPPAWAMHAHNPPPPHTHTPREQAQLSLSHRGTHPRPPAPASWKQSPPAGRWSSFATPERPSPALHPHSNGSACTAASGPLPCWNEPSALEFVEKSGVSRLLFFLARPYHKLVGKPEG